MPATTLRTETFQVQIDDRMIDGRLWRPDDGHDTRPPVVLWCGPTTDEDIVRVLTTAGLAVAAYDGGEASGRDAVDEASAVFRWLSLSGDLDLDRIGVLGYRTGALAAAGLAGRTDRIAALCLLAPVAGEDDGEDLDAVAVYDRPTLVLEGAADRTATPGFAATLAERIRNATHHVEHLVVARGDHDMGPPEARSAWVEPLGRFFTSMSPVGQPAASVE